MFWVIVDTGSTDSTCAIIEDYAQRYPFIVINRTREDAVRDFAAKVRAIRSGYELIRNESLEYLGILDADVSFGPDYYEKVLTRLRRSPGIGIAGGLCVDAGQSDEQEAPIARVRGAIQMFRAECYEDIGGLLPLESGGEDTVAVLMATMKGWEVQCYSDLPVLHHRRTATGESSIWKGRFVQGAHDFSLGYHPLYLVAKYLRRIGEKPYLMGSLLRLAGYGWSALIGKERLVPRNVVDYLRRIQIQRLKSFTTSRFQVLRREESIDFGQSERLEAEWE